MAILSGLEGLEVNIIVNGAPLQEYAKEEPLETPELCTTFVPAQTGVNFEVFYRFARPFRNTRAISTIITIDGQNVGEPLIPRRDAYDEEGHTIEEAVFNVGKKWYTQKFAFADLSINEDADEDTETAQNIDLIGTIKLEFFYLKKLKLIKAPNVSKYDVPGLNTISERVVKGDAPSHKTSLCEPEEGLDLGYYDAQYAKEKPFATFLYKYRSLETLKRLHIIERSRSPTPVPEQNVENAAGEAQRERTASVQEEQSSQPRIMREREDDDTTEANDPEVVFVRSKRLRTRVKKERSLVELD